MARRYRPRKMFKFWLFHDLAEDVRLMVYIQYLHLHEAPGVTFAGTVRNGLRLMWTLGQGDLSVLFELFPTLRSQFTPDNSALIEEFRRLLEAQQKADTSSSLQLTSLQPVAHMHSLPLSIDDDDEQDTIILKRSTNTDAGKNFLGSLASFR